MNFCLSTFNLNHERKYKNTARIAKQNESFCLAENRGNKQFFAIASHSSIIRAGIISFFLRHQQPNLIRHVR
jgi:hypothetical protein